MQRPWIYLDYASTAPIRPEVADLVSRVMRLGLGNPSSIHGAGREARHLIEQARRQVADLIHASPEEILFTSGGTEANNLALYGMLGSSLKRLITTRVEHLSILECARALSASGIEVLFLPVDEAGMPRLEALEEALKGPPALVSLAYVNNETGNIFPVDKVARRVKEAGGVLHVDAVQAAPHLSLDVKRDDIDLMSLSAHKLGALSGTGALYVRRPLRLSPLLRGGHQEREMRGGTENFCGIVAFGEAAALAAKERERSFLHLKDLRERLETGILQRIPQAKRSGHEKRAPHITNLRFPGCDGQLILIHLDLEGICAASGSACATGQLSPSHVLLAMGISEEEAQSAVRFSLGFHTTPEEIERVVDVLPGIIAKVREA